MGQRERAGAVSYAKPEDVLACVDTPVLEAIATHRRAAKAMLAAEAALRTEHARSIGDIDPAEEARLEWLAEEEWSASDLLARQIPETLPGLLMMLSYMHDALDADPNLFDEGERAVTLVRNLGLAAKAFLTEGRPED